MDNPFAILVKEGPEVQSVGTGWRAGPMVSLLTLDFTTASPRVCFKYKAPISVPLPQTRGT